MDLVLVDIVEGWFVHLRSVSLKSFGNVLVGIAACEGVGHIGDESLGVGVRSTIDKIERPLRNLGGVSKLSVFVPLDFVVDNLHPYDVVGIILVPPVRVPLCVEPINVGEREGFVAVLAEERALWHVGSHRIKYHIPEVTSVRHPFHPVGGAPRYQSYFAFLLQSVSYERRVREPIYKLRNLHKF